MLVLIIQIYKYSQARDYPIASLNHLHVCTRNSKKNPSDRPNPQLSSNQKK